MMKVGELFFCHYFDFLEQNSLKIAKLQLINDCFTSLSRIQFLKRGIETQFSESVTTFENY
jgi:hypothetical protein